MEELPRGQEQVSDEHEAMHKSRVIPPFFLPSFLPLLLGQS